MDKQPPFNPFESERTIIKPRPKLASKSEAISAAPLAPFSDTLPDLEPVELGESRLLNPLVSTASELLSLFAYLRRLPQAPQVTNLRSSLIAAMQRFESAARRQSLPDEQVIGARYMLCTAIDEGIANTPWGAQANWNQQSLLVQFHNETWGGEKVFQLMSKLAQDVPKNIHLLELIYCILGLGFEGRYRVIENGRSQLEAVRQRLADLIAKQRGGVESDLSPHWRSDQTATNKAADRIPFWIVAGFTAAVLGLIFVAIRLSLNYRSDSTYAQVSALRLPAAVAAPLPVPTAKKPRLTGFLEEEIKQGKVTVIESSDRTTIRLAGDQFFSSGSAEPLANAIATLRKIGDALAQVQGDVLINGHSDNQPIRSVRFPSNWHLSTGRAESVKAALISQVDPGRMKIAGKAEAEPLVANDTPENRAKNRRVDIVLIPADALASAGAKP